MPPKRQRSSSPLPTAKRHREALGDYVRTLNVPSQEGFPAIEEIVHHIFSYLSAVDLCAIQGVSNFWNRLASDNQLWKALYIHEHPRHRLPNTKTSFSNARNPQRQIRSLPQRAVEYEQKDYKWLYR
ncbi:hypothetical protein DL93DRAFT_2088773 [Clavulina sp. PMI_390]|nr:hypothetical protein DL93DRAFT_2088773 [Clavulina sp. PMI_390]